MAEEGEAEKSRERKGQKEKGRERGRGSRRKAEKEERRDLEGLGRPRVYNGTCQHCARETDNQLASAQSKMNRIFLSISSVLSLSLSFFPFFSYCLLDKD